MSKKIFPKFATALSLNLKPRRVSWDEHRETKELAGFMLTVAKNGPNLEAVGDIATDLSFKKATKTAVAGAYSVRLKWVPLQSLSRICRHFSQSFGIRWGCGWMPGRKLGEIIVIEQTPIENRRGGPEETPARIQLHGYFFNGDGFAFQLTGYGHLVAGMFDNHFLVG